MKVTSSNIEEVDHDPKTSALTVLFKNGGLYRYDGVPALVFEQLVAAESVGKALNTLVKGKFGYVRL